MSAKNNQHFDMGALNYHLGSMGFLYPVNEVQMKIFDILFTDFDYKLKDAKIDCTSIINGHVRQGTVHRLNNINEDDVAQLRMVARKGVSDLPKDVLDKIYGKHRKKPGDKE